MNSSLQSGAVVSDRLHKNMPTMPKTGMLESPFELDSPETFTTGRQLLQ